MQDSLAINCEPETTLVRIHIKYIDSTGKSFPVSAYEGDTLMTAATANAIPGIDGDCGGNCACGTCLLHIDARFIDLLTAPGAGELELLSHLGVSHRDHRLGCQITLSKKLDGATVTVADPR